MKKGFTLVELLGVIVLLGILSIVIIPKVGDALTSGKENAYNTQVETIKKAAGDFIIENDSIFDKDETTITLGILKQGGYLPIKIKNPKTRKDFSNTSQIIITKNQNGYDIAVNLIDLQDVTENLNANSPILVLNGEYIQYVEVGKEYEELGATAMTAEGIKVSVGTPTIKKDDVTVSNIDTSTLGTYSVIYEATSNGETISATRTVVVRDTQPPKLTIPNDTTIHISELSTYDLEHGVTVADNYDWNPSLQINSTISNIPGTYVVTYTATDSSGNVSTNRRIITVDGNMNNYYTQLAYIESTGTQYIMTNIKPFNSSGIYLKFASMDTYNDTIFVGSRNSSSDRFWIGNSRRAGTTDALYFGWNSATDSSNRPSISAGDIHTVKMNYLNDRKHIFDDTVVATNIDALNNTTVPITIFAGNANGTVTFKSKIRLYNLKISKTDEVKYDFVPCYRKSDGKIGLYDTINNVFYQNDGTGEFIKGEL